MNLHDILNVQGLGRESLWIVLQIYATSEDRGRPACASMQVDQKFSC